MVDSKKRPGKDLDRIDRNILNELQKMGEFLTSSFQTGGTFSDALP